MNWAEQYAEAYGGAGDEARALGAQWYPDVFRWCRRVAAGRSTPHRVAGALAAVSPRMRWDFAKRDVLGALDGEGFRWAFKSRRMIAGAILAGDARPMDALTGPKCSAFYRNICGDTDAVTLDVHMLRIVGHQNDVRPNRYAAIADALRQAATIHGVPPRDLQAAVWIAQRGRP